MKDIKSDSEKELKKQLNDIYTPLDEAKKEIERRWKDKWLEKRVLKFWGKNVPSFLNGQPQAFFSRDIVTPNFEFTHFLDKANHIKLEPVFLEYAKSKFVNKNPSKYYLCKMCFYDGEGKNGGQKNSFLKLVDFNKWEGENLNEIQTIRGEYLVNFHHRITREFLEKEKFFVIDISNWFNKTRDISENYYTQYLASFIYHGILFENFLTDDTEKDFTLSKVIPSFKEVSKIFGVKPLIVRLLQPKCEADDRWYAYPASVEKIVKKINP